VAEDALQREDVTTIGEESPSEAVSEHVRRAPLSQTGCAGEAADELLDGAGREATTSASDKERIVRGERSPAEKRHTNCAPGPPSKGYDSLLGPLAHHATPTLDEVDIADRDGDKLAKADARIEHQENDRSIARDITRPILDGPEKSPKLGCGQARDQDVRDLGDRKTGQWMGAQL
jgi:hypothetical protein